MNTNHTASESPSRLYTAFSEVREYVEKMYGEVSGTHYSEGKKTTFSPKARGSLFAALARTEI